MNQPLTIERRAIKRSLPRIAIFLIVTAVAYFALIASELGYGNDQLRTISSIVALIFAALIVNTAIGLLDIARYADIHRAERTRRKKPLYERC
jgi:hypothetical protein